MVVECMGRRKKRYTPAMRQFLEIKEQHENAIIFFRMGDFYETFFEDAKIAAEVLDIVLTSRGTTPAGDPIALAGIPYHALDAYLKKMVEKGYNVAICEQVEDASEAKGIVKREVVRVVTPGTITDENMLEERANNFLMALTRRDDRATGRQYGIAFADVSTGDFFATHLEGEDVDQRFISEVIRFKPAECILPPELVEEPMIAKLFSENNVCLQSYPSGSFALEHASETLCDHFSLSTIEGLDDKLAPLALSAAGAAIDYLRETQMASLNHINELSTICVTDHMILDSTTLTNLEIVRNIRDQTTRGTLLGVLDRTKSAMGSRLLKKWLLRPLYDLDAIEARHAAVEEVCGNLFVREDVRELLKSVSDIERLVSRIVLERANARDLVALKGTLRLVPDLKRHLAELKPHAGRLRTLMEDLDPNEAVVDLIERGILDEPNTNLKAGGIIKDGYDEQLDQYRDAMKNGKQWVRDLEAQERERTQIKSLKVGFNKVFGYYLEVTNPNLDRVPDDYTRKQTLANSERYIIPELKEKEALILSAEEKSQALEYDLFLDIRATISGSSSSLRQTAQAIAEIDVLFTLAEVAVRQDYNRPELNYNDAIYIRDGRHPVVEEVSDDPFIPNDTYTDCQDHQVLILTGPNMAGKSTYMRQIALIVILAQIGSFVPASRAKIGVVDRVFTRVGAYDDLTRGQSTFMVEMIELANILTSATSRSLILLDEIGRGTSTYDGLGIAWAVVEFIHHREHIGAKTVFATHYHHLNELARVLDRVRNYHVVVKEDGDSIIFLYKVEPGGTDKSYGIEVARLAGVPETVVQRAKEVLQKIEEDYMIETRPEEPLRSRPSAYKQLQFLKLPGTKRAPPSDAAPDAPAHAEPVPAAKEPPAPTPSQHPVIAELETIDVLNLTPLDALSTLKRLQDMLEREDGTEDGDGDADADVVRSDTEKR